MSAASNPRRKKRRRKRFMEPATSAPKRRHRIGRATDNKLYTNAVDASFDRSTRRTYSNSMLVKFYLKGNLQSESEVATLSIRQSASGGAPCESRYRVARCSGLLIYRSFLHERINEGKCYEDTVGHFYSLRNLTSYSTANMLLPPKN
ncbi:unnamed protein product, partial [Iphiclides podalirius]